MLGHRHLFSRSSFLASIRIERPGFRRAAALLAGLASLAFPGFADEVRSLRIADRVKGPGGKPGSVVVTYHLVNDSKKTITAWDFTCVIASQSGEASYTGSGGDGYFALELLRRDGPNESLLRGLILPGGSLTREIEVYDGELDGPLAAKSCAPEMVVFDDATFEGRPELAEACFESRARDAISAYRTRIELEKELGRGSSLKNAMTAVALRRQRPLDSPEGSDLGARRLETFLSLGKARGAEDLQQLLSDLDSYFRGAMAHLPRSWQSRVLTEVEK